MYRTHFSNEIKPEDNVQVAGWVHDIRDIGKLIFITLRDREGSVQITGKTGVTKPEVFEFLKKIGKEDVISVTGKAEPSNQAPGGFEIKPDKAELVAQSDKPLPLDVSGKIHSNIDTRLDNRFLDLRHAEVVSIFKIQAKIQEAFGNSLRGQKFLEIQPPCIISSSSEGGAELFAMPYFNEEAFLAQSPQLYKQMAVVGGFDRVWMIVPVWRAEMSHTVKHLTECRQMDIEMGFTDDSGAMDVLEKVVENVFSEVSKHCTKDLETISRKGFEVPKLPLRRITYTEVLEMLAKEGINIKWGEDLSSPAEKKICELVGWETPFLITGWPTDIRAFYSMPDEENPKMCKAFDLMYRGLELCSGAQRIHLPKLLEERIKAKGMNPENFKDYINTFRFGAPPHAGWSIGLERITMAITGVENIREATLFPRDPDRLRP